MCFCMEACDVLTYASKNMPLCLHMPLVVACFKAYSGMDMTHKGKLVKSLCMPQIEAWLKFMLGMDMLLCVSLHMPLTATNFKILLL